jgi:hypothetical protein
MSVKIAVPLAAMSAAVLLLAACFGGGDQASVPPTAREPAATASTSKTAVTVTATEPKTGLTATEPATVTEVADVPTRTEVGTDVLPKSAPPWHKERSLCNTHSFSIVYDRELPAILVRHDNRVIAWAGLYRRDVSDRCRVVPRRPPAPASNEPVPKGIYESVDLLCNSPGRIQIDTHPIEMNGSVYGSQVYITVAGKPQWLVSAVAVEDVEGRRVYFNDDYCGRS